MGEYNRRLFVGEVAGYAFNNYIGTFTLRTWAESEAAARRNFAYQIKRTCGLVPSARIRVEGVINEA